MAACDWLLRSTAGIQENQALRCGSGPQIRAAGVSVSNVHIALKNDSHVFWYIFIFNFCSHYAKRCVCMFFFFLVM